MLNDQLCPKNHRSYHIYACISVHLLFYNLHKVSDYASILIFLLSLPKTNKKQKSIMNKKRITNINLSKDYKDT